MKIEIPETGRFVYVQLIQLFFPQMYQHSLKKGLMKKFENWRYRENKRSPDFLEQKAKKKKKTEGT